MRRRESLELSLYRLVNGSVKWSQAHRGNDVGNGGARDGDGARGPGRTRPGVPFHIQIHPAQKKRLRRGGSGGVKHKSGEIGGGVPFVERGAAPGVAIDGQQRKEAGGGGSQPAQRQTAAARGPAFAALVEETRGDLSRRGTRRPGAQLILQGIVLVHNLFLSSTRATCSRRSDSGRRPCWGIFPEGAKWRQRSCHAKS